MIYIYIYDIYIYISYIYIHMIYIYIYISYIYDIYTNNNMYLGYSWTIHMMDPNDSGKQLLWNKRAGQGSTQGLRKSNAMAPSGPRESFSLLNLYQPGDQTRPWPRKINKKTLY